MAVHKPGQGKAARAASSMEMLKLVAEKAEAVAEGPRSDPTYKNMSTFLIPAARRLQDEYDANRN